MPARNNVLGVEGQEAGAWVWGGSRQSRGDLVTSIIFHFIGSAETSLLLVCLSTPHSRTSRVLSRPVNRGQQHPAYPAYPALCLVRRQQHLVVRSAIFLWVP